MAYTLTPEENLFNRILEEDNYELLKTWYDPENPEFPYGIHIFFYIVEQYPHAINCIDMLLKETSDEGTYLITKEQITISLGLAINSGNPWGINYANAILEIIPDIDFDYILNPETNDSILHLMVCRAIDGPDEASVKRYELSEKEKDEDTLLKKLLHKAPLKYQRMKNIDGHTPLELAFVHLDQRTITILCTHGNYTLEDIAAIKKEGERDKFALKEFQTLIQLATKIITKKSITPPTVRMRLPPLKHPRAKAAQTFAVAKSIYASTICTSPR